MTIDSLAPLIRRAAKSVAGQWPGVIEKEDAEQAISLHLLERPNSVDKIKGMDDAARYRAIVGIGHQIAGQERIDYDYFSGSFNYSVDDVKTLLKRDVLTQPVAEFDAAVADLIDGLLKVVVRSPQYVEAVVSRYADGITPKTGAAKKRLTDALETVTRQMNNAAKARFSERDDGPGTRKVMTSNQMRWESKGGWDADYTPEIAEFRDNRTEPEYIPLLGVNK